MAGMIYVFTGEGKGKTTAAMGLAVRAALVERKVAVVQFLKGSGFTGELQAAQFLSPYLKIEQFGFGCPVADRIRSGEKVCTKCGRCFQENRNPDNLYAVAAWQRAGELLDGAEVALLVLDEISHAIRHGLLDLSVVSSRLAKLPPTLDIVLTGRYMPEELVAMAAVVTEAQAVKHPMLNGIDARRGIEY